MQHNVCANDSFTAVWHDWSITPLTYWLAQEDDINLSRHSLKSSCELLSFSTDP
jgi:hypothetical protein